MPSNGEKQNILVITQFYFPSTEIDYKIKEKIENMASQGNNISVIATKDASDSFSEIENVKFHFIDQEKFKGGSEWAYVYHNIIFLWKSIRLGLGLKENFDLVEAVLPTGFAGITAKIIAGNKKTKYSIDEKENWIENALNKNYLIKNSPFHKAAVFIDNWLKK